MNGKFGRKSVKSIRSIKSLKFLRSVGGLREGNIVVMALVLTTTLLVSGIGISIVVMEGTARAKEADNAVAAYYMANAGIEQQLYEIRKNGKTLAEVAAASSSYPGGTSWHSTTGYVTNTSKTIESLEKEQLAFVDLFDPDDLSSISNVDKVVISWSPDPASCVAPTVPDMEVGFAAWQFSGGGVTWPDAAANYTIVPFQASPMTIGNPTIVSSNAYRMRLRPFKCNAINVVVQMRNAADVPLAYPGDITLGSEGTYGKTTQKITVSMPRQDILSGIFSYIVFSQEALCKRVGAAGVCPP